MVFLPVLDYLKLQLADALPADAVTHMRYPTAISRLLGIRICEVDKASATVEIDADPALHGNQQGTVHGGLLCELADAAIGTAHSTVVEAGESFASIELHIRFFRPVFRTTLRAQAKAIHLGRNLSHYRCEILRGDGKLAASVTSAVMSLRGEQARGR
ncbi:MAG: PaaI family thioesterase [Pseudomonadota bacterium]|nr:MAG: thioesterase [Pseudomonadota bacterium]